MRRRNSADVAENALTEAYDFVQTALGELLELLDSLAEVLKDDRIRKLILADLGLDPDSGAELSLPEQNLDSIRAYVERTDTDLEAFLAVVDDVSQIIEAIESFIETASADPTTEEAVRETLFQLFLLSSLLQYRYKAPGALALAEILGIVNYGLENYELTGLVFEQVGRLARALKKLGLGLNEFIALRLARLAALENPLGGSVEDLERVADFTTEAHARVLSDLFLLPSAALLAAKLDLKEEPTSWLDTELLYGWDFVGEPSRADVISNRILSTNFTAKFKDRSELLLTLSGADVPDALDGRVLSASVRQQFASAGHVLADTAFVVVKQPGKKWLVVDDVEFTVKGEASGVNVYSSRAANTASLGLGAGLVPRDDGGPGLFLALGGGVDRTFPLSADWTLEARTTSSTALSLFLSFDDIGNSQVFGPADAGLALKFKRKDNVLLRRAQLPSIAGSNLSFGAFEFGVELTTRKLEFKALSKDNTLIVSGAGADGFIRRSLPAGEVRADFDVGLSYELFENELRFTDGSKLTVVLPLGQEILGVRIVYLTLEIAPLTEGDDTHVRIETSASLSIKWGPFTSAIDRIGLEILVPPPKDAAGNRDWRRGFAFKPPTGVGFAIDTTAVSGGGFLFFDRQNEEYAGILQLEIVEEFDLKAIGLISTGDEGFSILAIASVEFTPGWQLIWGFTLEGVGLLVGVNRSMVLEALRTGVRSGTLDSILFPDDPVRNAPKIINDLRAVFPPTSGRHVFGGLLFISWAGLKSSFRLKLGVVLELPPPVKLTILGQLEITLPSKKLGVVLIRTDIVGVWDQAAKSISVDAALRDSKVGQFPLTGELAVRGNWGTRKVFIFAAGGVHPAFNPPAELPQLKRLQIALGTGDNPRLRLLGYLAVTSNTFQVGARAELFARKSGFSLEGWAGIDALFEFDPFVVVVDFSAGVTIKRGSRVLFSLTLKATLEGFTPVRVDGKVKFKIFLVKVSIPVHLKIGESRDAVLEDIDALAEVLAALRDPNNWAGELTGTRAALVTLSDAPADKLKVHPLAALSVRQQVVPMGVEIQLFKNATPSGARRFDITTVEVNGVAVGHRPVQEFFAPAQFFDMSDDEKLARPSFEELPAGVIADDGGLKHGAAVSSEVTYETIVIDKPDNRPVRVGVYVPNREAFVAAAGFGASAEPPAGMAGAGKYRVAALGIRVQEGQFGVASVDDLRAAAAVPVIGSYTQALAALRSREAAHPEDARRMQVVAVHEQVAS
jgi:hypothetical protein